MPAHTHRPPEESGGRLWTQFVLLMNDGELGLDSCDPRSIDQPETPAQGQPCFVDCSSFKITPDKLSNPGEFINAFQPAPSSVPYT